MGAEARCRVDFDSKSSTGVAHLETAELLFRGDFRLLVRFAEITSVSASGGTLTLEFPGGPAVLQLGSQAPVWAEKIRNPKPVLDKLGVKPEHDVGVIGIDDEAFLKQLNNRAATVWSSRPKKETDIILFGASRKKDLDRLATLRNYIRPTGAIWIVRPKGANAELKESDIFERAKAHDLVDVKVVAFSSTHSALKVVIPVALR